MDYRHIASFLHARQTGRSQTRGFLGVVWKRFTERQSDRQRPFSVITGISILHDSGCSFEGLLERLRAFQDHLNYTIVFSPSHPLLSLTMVAPDGLHLSRVESQPPLGSARTSQVKNVLCSQCPGLVEVPCALAQPLPPLYFYRKQHMLKHI